MSGLRDLSVMELRNAIARGETSSEQATREYLEAIEAGDPRMGAFTEVHAERAIERAQQMDRQPQTCETPPLLAGVPISLKDNLCTDYGRTTCSSRLLANFQAPYCATVVEKVEAAGAVVLGKTNLDEFAMGSSTENSAFQPTRNPWDLQRVPGGSSGGAAAAVAARMCAAAIGSDTGGSIRQPAGFCGVVGFKPTYGRVSRYGLIAYGSSLDQIGPLARDVSDAALLLQVLAGHDSKDATSLPAAVDDYLNNLDKPIDRLRIGLPKEFYSDALDAELNETIHRAAETMRNAGCEIVDVSLPHHRVDRDENGEISSYIVACYYIIAMAEASSNLARYDGVHYGHRTKAQCEDILELYSRSRAEGFGEEVKRRIMLGSYTLSAGYYDAYYNKALKVRRLIFNDYVNAFEDCDVLLCPVAPTPPFRIGEKTDDPLSMYLADIYTLSLNLAGLPGLSLPAGVSEAGLPLAMQFIGPALSEATVLRAARMYERAGGISRLLPPEAVS
jgi:aspartyl-tRNA(Asn)/glutamyl-tRNA(Gln) amidotransferase subunit A